MKTKKAMKRVVKKTLLSAALIVTAASAQSQDAIDVAFFTESGDLLLPDDIDRWVVVGASLGSNYAEEPSVAEGPGPIGVVQMEPAAYEYFLEHGEYADGTMFYLTFYASESQSEPQLRGFVQGEVVAREIHLIDASRYEDGRAFFLFARPDQPGRMLPSGNDCVACHAEHGQLDGTFTQFYPPLRSRLAD